MEKEKIWTTPELIVLARSNPEEAVLDGCKGSIKAGPNWANAACTTSATTPPDCNRAAKS